MAQHLNVVISIGAKDAARDAYPAQIRHEGQARANAWAQIDLQALLEAEYENQNVARVYGVRLRDALFVGDVGNAYQQLIGHAGPAADIRVQLEIHPDAPELHALSWERLFHVFGGGDTPLAASVRTPFSRFLVTGHGEHSPLRARPFRILVAIANPLGLPPQYPELDVAGEVASLADAFAGLQGRVLATLMPSRSGLPAELRARLLREGWKIHDGITSWQAIQRHLPDHHALHILAHGQFKRGETPGTGTAYLLLESEGRPASAGQEAVPPGALLRVADDEIVLGLAGVPLPQLIFLAACDSASRPAAAQVSANPFVGLAPKLVRAGVPAVVAMQDLVPIDLARTLAADFYRRLFDHGRVDRALNESRSLVLQRNLFEWAIPALFLRLRDGLLFDPPNPGLPRLPFEPETVWVAPGEFVMGSEPGAGGENETPRHSVTTGEYWIGKYPVTNAQYAVFLDRNPGYRPLPPQAGWLGRKPRAAKRDHPVVWVSWADATAYCRWLTEQTKALGRCYRLPTEAEWEKAARGPFGQVYPWGEEWIEGRCNVGAAGTAPVTAHPQGVSPYGCEDMVGNAEEWTSTIWGAGSATPDFGYPYAAGDGREEPDRGGEFEPHLYRVARGCAYDSPTAAAHCTRRVESDQAARLPWRGFRVAMEVS